jgi:hypothetical protein
MKYYNLLGSSVLLTIMFISSCCPSELFTPIEPLFIDRLNPLGIAKDGNHLWISDNDHNRVINVDREGNTVTVIEELERPMHIDFADGKLFIPFYGLKQY